MGINEYIKIGSRIKQLRIEKGISQKDMASMIGIPVSTYSNYENDYREPKAEIIDKIASVLEIKICELLNSDDFKRKILDGDDTNEFPGTLGALNGLMKSVGCFIEAEGDNFMLYNPHIEGIIVSKEDIEWLIKETQEYLLFRIDKLYLKHYND